MAEDNVQGMVVKVGVTDDLFTQGISKINKSMSLLQSEFKASSESVKGFGSSTDQLQNKQDYLNKAMEIQKAKIQALKDGYEKAKSETGEFSNATQNAGVKLNNAIAYFNKMQNELKQVDEALQNDGNEVKKEESIWSKFGDKLKGTLGDIGESVKHGIGFGAGMDIWDKAKESFGGMISFGTDLQKSLNGLQSSTGVADSAMKEMKQTMLGIYNDNFGENFADIGDSMKIVSQQTGASGDSLKKLTENALLLRDTFDFDVNESVRSANMLIKQFGMSGDEAYNLIAQGAQWGLDKNQDLLDSVNEYSNQFQQAGFSAEEMFNMLANGAMDGTFSVDKLGRWLSINLFNCWNAKSMFI